jgi:NADH dehydrogenase
MKVTGFLAYVMWGFIHVLYLIGWGNRLGTLYTWLRALVFSKNRGHRIITFEQAHDQAQEHKQPPSPPAVDVAGRPVQPVAERAG